jgi:hypothetical protein
MEGVTMVRTWLIVISEGDTPMICEVSTAKITGFKSLNKNHPGNLKIKQVFEIIKNSKLADFFAAGNRSLR